VVPEGNLLETEIPSHQPFLHKKQVILMVDITQHTIKKLFNERVREMTKRTLAAESMDFQFSEQWIHA